MLLTERILIKPNHSHYRSVRKLCRETTLVSNQALYYFRQSFFNHEKITWPTIDKLLKLKHSNKYCAIPNAISQSVIKKVGTDFKSFWQAHKQWEKHPSKFKAKPKIPNYRALKTATQPAQGVSVRDGHLVFPSKLNLSPLKIRCASEQIVLAKSENAIVKEIRYVPHGSCFWLEIVYDENKILHQDIKTRRKTKLNEKNVLSIDIGVNNLATLVSNKPDFRPVLISGKPVKSLNQRFNKNKAELQSLAHRKMIAYQSVGRFCAITDYFHKVSHYIIKTCLEGDIGHIVIGKNDDWKQRINIGKVNNQQFVSIPFATLISQIRYKAEQYGIKVTLQEESYTSKADSLALDELPVYQKGQSVRHVFSGKRIKRGLYQSVTGKLLNADVNGAINILRKVIGDGFVKGLFNKGAVFAPMRWTPAH
jgi:putative transposase